MTNTEPAQTPARNSALPAWLRFGGVVIALLGAGVAGLGYVYASKAELQEVELSLAKEVGSQKLRDWRIRNLEVKFSNLEIRNQRMDENIVSLMERFRVIPKPEPVYRSLPAPPLTPNVTSP